MQTPYLATPFVLSLLPVLVPVQAQVDPEKLDARGITSGEFEPARFGPVRWIDSDHLATLDPAPGGGVRELVRYDPFTDRREVLVSAARLDVDALGGRIEIEDYAFSPDQKQVLVFTKSERVWGQITRGEYLVFPLAGDGGARRLGGALPKSSLMFAKWSPDSTRVAYVAQNDLWVEDVATRKQTRLTNDGCSTRLNGSFDRAYEKGFDCRDGFRWSPDGDSIAFWQLDCGGVGEFLMIDNLADRYAKVVPVQYPKAGTTNPACRVGVIAATGGNVTWMQTPGDPRETYIARMEWHPKGKELMVQLLPRAQNALQVLGCDVKTGVCRVVHEEQDEAYVDVRDDFRWLNGGEKFLWTSDNAFHSGSGPRFRQCGTIEWDTRGKQVEVTHIALTSGFDVIAVKYVDLTKDQLYVTRSKGPMKLLYRVQGGVAAMVGRFPRPSEFWFEEGEYLIGFWHDYQFSPDGRLAIHTYSDFVLPPHVQLVRLPDHKHVSSLVDHAALRERCAALMRRAPYELDRLDVQVDGVRVALDRLTMFPYDFDSAKWWPVVFYVCEEPWSQTAWGFGHRLFHLWLTQLGYVVMSVDVSATAPKGRDWREALNRMIGVPGSADWNAAVTNLCRSNEWMDRSRLAIWGWGSGGAMTLNMLFRYPDLFAAGMAVAPVTDFTLCDTIYQERYCGDPRQFPGVYQQCSPITFACDLKAHLLLVHGTGDEDVHFQHSERLVDELVRHGRLFEYLAYPNRTNAIREREGTRAHFYASLTDFLQRRVPAGPRARN